MESTKIECIAIQASLAEDYEQRRRELDIKGEANKKKRALIMSRVLQTELLPIKATLRPTEPVVKVGHALPLLETLEVPRVVQTVLDEVPHIVQGVLEEVPHMVQEVMEVPHIVQKASKDLRRSRWPMLRSAMNLASEVSHLAADVGSDVVHRAADMGSDVVHRAADMGSDVVHRANDLSQAAVKDVVHKASDLGHDLMAYAQDMTVPTTPSLDKAYLIGQQNAERLRRETSDSEDRSILNALQVSQIMNDRLKSNDSYIPLSDRTASMYWVKMLDRAEARRRVNHPHYPQKNARHVSGILMNTRFNPRSDLCITPVRVRFFSPLIARTHRNLLRAANVDSTATVAASPAVRDIPVSPARPLAHSRSANSIPLNSLEYEFEWPTTGTLPISPDRLNESQAAIPVPPPALSQLPTSPLALHSSSSLPPVFPLRRVQSGSSLPSEARTPRTVPILRVPSDPAVLSPRATHVETAPVYAHPSVQLRSSVDLSMIPVAPPALPAPVRGKVNFLPLAVSSPSQQPYKIPNFDFSSLTSSGQDVNVYYPVVAPELIEQPAQDQLLKPVPVAPLSMTPGSSTM